MCEFVFRQKTAYEMRICDWSSDVCSSDLAGLSFFRREAPARPVICMIEPSIVLVAQGVKQVWVGGKAYGYDTTRFPITSLDIPANSEVMVASPAQPCLGLVRSEEHTSELQSLMRISYAVFCLKTKKQKQQHTQ